MIRRFRAWFICLFVCTASSWAQTPDLEEAPTPPPSENYESLSARQAVREGNLRLAEGDAEEALEAYARARDLRPEAPQIPFVQGLAELKRKDYDAARDRFRETAASDDDALAADAQYALGASYHLEALESENPEEAIEQLEAAMERYRDVLARRPDHALARESDYKAASMRRQLKQLLQQQQQQQQQQNQNGEEQENQDQQQSDSQDQQEGEQQEQDEQSQSEQQEGEDQQQQQSAEQQQDESQDQQSQSEQEQHESEDQKEAQASEQEEDVSREQAERRLREMMQSIRDKEKRRRKQVRKVPLPPVEKDW